uniref:Uncharacterized protein n=1 Tax=Ditylenchus dipsaci TaxID=166011 RepID=A0A915D6H0_9BILA
MEQNWGKCEVWKMWVEKEHSLSALYIFFGCVAVSLKFRGYSSGWVVVLNTDPCIILPRREEKRRRILGYWVKKFGAAVDVAGGCAIGIGRINSSCPHCPQFSFCVLLLVTHPEEILLHHFLLQELLFSSGWWSVGWMDRGFYGCPFLRITN